MVSSSSPKSSPLGKNISPTPSNSSKSNSKSTSSNTPPRLAPKNKNNYHPPLSPGHSSRDNYHSPSHPRKNGGHASPTKISSTKNDTDGKMIIGVAAGAGLLVVVALFFVARCVFPKKKKRQQNPHFEPQAGGGDPRYNNSYNPPQWGNGFQGAEHSIRVPPPNGGGSGGSGWGASSQLHLTTSGGGNGCNPSSQVPGPAYSGESSYNFSGLFQHGLPPPPPPPGIPIGFNKNSFTYEDLLIATNGFSESNLIGQGGFGYVHRGMLPDGKEVAIKSLKIGSGQGEREFQDEVEIISRVHHRHLVSLVGYCVAGAQRMLVYDFVPNKTLEHHLHGKGVPVMDFASRLRIALGAAKGLAYLHEDCHPRIIHRDIKAANILIDENFEAMVADFELARLYTDNHTHVSTRVMGTFGYLAPEYASSGKLTEKSDVYSFGIMLLELITGKPPVDNTMEDTLVDWARPLLECALETDNHVQLVDPRLERNYDHIEMQHMIACASASVRHSARRRPKISQIVRALLGQASLDDLSVGLNASNSSLASLDNNSAVRK